MKYVVIVALLILFMRIDFWLNFFDKKLADFTQKSENEPGTLSQALKVKKDIISIPDDKSLKQTPKVKFLALLGNFHDNPTSVISEKILSTIRSNPTLFDDKLDKDLELEIFQWTDLLTNNQQEAVKLVMNLMNVLRGENQLMIKRFLSLWLDINMKNFIESYSNSTDTNCSVAKMFGYEIPVEEKVNELMQREESLKKIVSSDSISEFQKSYISTCLLVLQVEISQITSESVDKKDSENVTLPSSEPLETGVSP